MDESIRYVTATYYDSAMPATEVARFRHEVEETRKLAEKAISPLDKEAWLRIAAEWNKLAHGAERRRS
jgi:hypothetical protein